MKIKELFEAKKEKLWNEKAPTVAFLGDSITQGCFEFYMDGGKLKTVFDREGAPSSYFLKEVSKLYPSVPVNIINAGLSGISAAESIKRVERDVTAYNPDLTVVSFGLNDTFGREQGLEKYVSSLQNIFEQIKENGGEIIFMTQNMMNTYVSEKLTEPYLINLAKETASIQNGGICDMYFDEGKNVALNYGAAVCDVYSKWTEMNKNGVDTTALLSNHINHPTREMNKLYAEELVKVMFG